MEMRHQSEGGGNDRPAIAPSARTASLYHGKTPSAFRVIFEGAQDLQALRLDLQLLRGDDVEF